MRSTIVSFCALVALAHASCTDISNPVAVGDPAAIVTAGPPGSLVFHSERSGNSEIYVADPDGTNPHPIAADPAEDVWPDLSPNGRHVTFASRRTGNFEVLVVGLDDGSLINVSNRARDDNWPRFSPNGKEIAFHSFRDGNYEIYVANSDGTGTPRRVTNSAGADQYPDWSPDGKRIAFARRNDIWVIDADGEEQNPRQLTVLRGQMPVWSPNGQQIAFMSNREGYCAVFLMSAEGDSPANPAINLTPRDPANPNPWCSLAPAWSRNGQQIYYMSFRPSTGGTGFAFQIFVMNADGSEPTRLTSGEDGGPRAR